MTGVQTCALPISVLNIQSDYNLIESVVSGAGGGLGFMLSIVLFAGIRERLETADMPAWLDGFPGALITAGLMAIAFLGFNGMIK